MVFSFHGPVHRIECLRTGIPFPFWMTVAWWGEGQDGEPAVFLCERLSQNQWRHGRDIPNLNIVGLLLEEYNLGNAKKFDGWR